MKNRMNKITKKISIKMKMRFRNKKYFRILKQRKKK